MAKITIKVDPRTGQNYWPREIRREGFVGEVQGLSNALTVIFMKPGASMSEVAKSLRIIQQDIRLRREQAAGDSTTTRYLAASAQTEGQVARRPLHPLFIKYKRDWLAQVTGFSKAYLCRVATGRSPLSRSFIDRVCFKLNRPPSELFLTE